MKRLLKKRWHSIPVALVSALLVLVLVAGGAFAAINLSEDQTITQTVENWEYGSITVAQPDLELSSMKTGESYNEAHDIVFIDAVTVVVGEDGKGKWLHLKLDKASASPYYDMYGVSLVDTVELMDRFLSVQFGMKTIDGVPIPDVLDYSVQLTEAGTYTFNEYIVATAGDATGTAQVKVTISLEDDPAP
ncbi:hypothetical protein ES708_00003 [subsurface metagenome]